MKLCLLGIVILTTTGALAAIFQESNVVEGPFSRGGGIMIGIIWVSGFWIINYEGRSRSDQRWEMMVIASGCLASGGYLTMTGSIPDLYISHHSIMWRLLLGPSILILWTIGYYMISHTLDLDKDDSED